MKLSEVPVNSIFVDTQTTYNGEPIEWKVAAINVEGQGISSLIMKTPLSGKCFDAKEPTNPETEAQSNGNGTYAISNILQWLNSDSVNWYVAQHQYDQAPNSDAVGGTYASEQGFLRNFGNSLKSALQSVTKLEVSKKVHLPSWKELNLNDAPSSSIYDEGATYTGFSFGIVLYKNDWISLRSNPTNTSNLSNVGRVHYNNSSNREEYNSYSAYRTGIDDSHKFYIDPVIYVDNDLDVVYDSTTGKFYHNFKFETEYADYGSHKGGFGFNVKITTDSDSVATVTAYNGNDLIKTFSVSTFNAFTTLTFADSDVVSLSEGNNTIRLVVTQGLEEDETSFTYTKIADTVPVILTNTVGNVAQAFTTTYQVYEDDGDSIDVVVRLDSTQIDSQTDVSQHTDLPITVTASQFSSLSYGSHTLTIEATDGTNTSTATISFVKKSIPTVSLSPSEIGEVTSPFTVTVNANSADGDTITIKAYIDGQEITV